MKQKLAILAVVVAVAVIGCWRVLAGVNPLITYLDLSIDGVADGQEFVPGGYVPLNGWKKITLTATGNSPMKTRLDWNSSKIEVWTATSGGTQITRPKLWDPASGMPSVLWVKGVDVSTTGPTATSGGPEHMTLEAINNGDNPPNPGTYYDRIALTVFTVDSIKVTPKGLPSGAAVSDPVCLGAGAMASDAHQGTVEIQLSPSVAGIPLDISIVGGQGHDAGNEARLVVGQTTVVGGGSVATISSGASGLITGDLTSSDVLESCKIHTDPLEREVVFTWDDISEDGEWVSSPDYLPDSGVVTHTLTLRHHRDSSNWRPFNAHAVRMFVEEVQYLDANGVLQTLTYTANPNNQAQLDQWASCPTTDTIADADGQVSIDMTIHQSGLRSVTVAAYDWSVWQPSASGGSSGANPASGGIAALAQSTGTAVREDKASKKLKADDRDLPNCLLDQPAELPLGTANIWVYVPVDPLNASLLSVTITPLKNSPVGGLTKVANLFASQTVPQDFRLGTGPCTAHDKAICFQLEATKGGTYNVEVAYNGLIVKYGTFACSVLEGKMTFDPKTGPVLMPQTSKYVLPMNELAASGQLVSLVATAVLGQPAMMTTADYKARLSLKGGAAAIKIATSAGQQFISSVATPGSSLNATATGIKSVDLKATLEADGGLKRDATNGRYQIKDAKRTINKVRCNNPCTGYLSLAQVQAPQTRDGNLESLDLACPDIQIARPTGDPTAAAGAAGANADNEAVFDDQVPQGEGAGTCRIDAEGRVLSGLSAAASASIWSMLEWNIDDAGKVTAGYTPVQNAVHKQTIVYPSMPTAPTAFGAKTLRLRFKAAYNRPSWRCEQPMELFFHYAGTGNPAQNQPNWLYYWSQIQGAVAGGGNGGKLSLGAGTINGWTWLGGNKGSTITLAPPGALSVYVGILAHEQKHENDFFDVIWQGGGYNPAADGDKDDLRDGWEIAQYGDTSKDFMYAFESEVAHAAWSDVRADVAAKDAVNAKLDIDSPDWSDLKVEPGLIWFFNDEDRPQSEAQTCNPTTSGNHKQF